jgi:hypothetical protein
MTTQAMLRPRVVAVAQIESSCRPFILTVMHPSWRRNPSRQLT